MPNELDELKTKLQAIIDEYKTVSQAKQSEFKTANPSPTQPVAAAQNISNSVGKGGANIPAEVQLVQKLLNQKLNLTLSTDGKAGAKTIAAIEQFQKSIFNGWSDGKIEAGGKTWTQLSGNNPVPNPIIPPKPTGNGQNGKVGNTIFPIGAAWLSVPPNASGATPMVFLFAGKGQAANALMKDCPDSYYQKAILIFAASSGSYSAAVAAANPILSQQNCSIGTISICGYSLGGQAAYRNYANATKAVGLIDPTTYWDNLAILDNKAVLSCRPAIWTFGGNYKGNDPKKKGNNAQGKPNYTAGQAQRDAVEIIKTKGGFGETTQVGHGEYPKYFLSSFESKLI